jgi:hypothetical protein
MARSGPELGYHRHWIADVYFSHCGRREQCRGRRR